MILTIVRVIKNAEFVTKLNNLISLIKIIALFGHTGNVYTYSVCRTQGIADINYVN
jgi:predicted CDP-diglyceride synthetase/phosphatidate cytidylyltransferase